MMLKSIYIRSKHYLSYIAKNTSVFEYVCFMLQFFLVLLTFISKTINHYFIHYQYNRPSFQIQSFILIFIGVVIFLLSQPLKEVFPKSFTLSKIFSLYIISWAVIFICYTGLVLTPFKNIDYLLYSFDQMLGFNQNEWVAWIFHHTKLHHFFVDVYQSLTLQAFLLPFIAGFILSSEEVERFLLQFMLTLSIGFLIYYFFPTASPASLLNHQYLSSGQINLAKQYWQIHHMKNPNVIGAGLISFPSFHVIWSSLFTWLYRRKYYIFYPLLILNILLWISTILLGWHYILDVISALLIVGIAIYICNRISV